MGHTFTVVVTSLSGSIERTNGEASKTVGKLRNEERMAEDNSKLDPETQSTIAWTICCINAFCMMCSGLSIDIMALVKYLRAHVRWQILVGLVCQLMVMPLA